MSKFTKQLYTFKPFVLQEHTSEYDDDEQPEGSCRSKIYYRGYDLCIYRGSDPAIIDVQELDDDVIHLVTKPEFHDMWIFNLLLRKWAYINIKFPLSLLPHNEIGVIFERNLLTICTMQLSYSDKLLNLYIFDILNEYMMHQPVLGEVPKYPSSCNIIRDGEYYYFVGDDDQNNFVGNVYRVNMKSGISECVYKCQGKDKKNELWKSIPYYLVFDGKTIFTFFCLDETDDEYDDDFTPYSFVKLAAFDVENRRWRMINTHGDVDHVPNYPVYRDGHSGARFQITHYQDSNNDVIVILSGQMAINNDHNNDLWTLNLSTMTWKNINNHGSLIPRTFKRYSMTVSPAGQLFTFGGFIGEPNDEVPCYSRVHSVWITIPKLTDICWESIFHYLPSLVSMSPEQVENLGISWKFLQSRIN